MDNQSGPRGRDIPTAGDQADGPQGPQRPIRKPPTNTGPGARPGGPRESGPRAPGFDGGPTQQFPRIHDAIQGIMAHLTPEQQQLIQGQIGPLVAQMQSHFDNVTGGMRLPFHPSLDHTHGPDGQMMHSVGMGGLGLPPGAGEAMGKYFQGPGQGGAPGRPMPTSDRPAQQMGMMGGRQMPQPGQAAPSMGGKMGGPKRQPLVK